MKRVWIFFCCLLLSSLLSSCTIINDGNEARLIVNGEDITKDHYLDIDVEKKIAQIPIVAILKELGVSVEETVTYTADTNFRVHSIYTEFNGYTFAFCSAESNYGLKAPDWLHSPVRKIKNKELIVDHVSVSALLYYIWEAEITVDYEKKEVYVDSIELPVDEELLKNTNAQLIVNGNDITEGNYAYIDYEKENTVLPVTTVLKALGAKIEWYPLGEHAGIGRSRVYFYLNGKGIYFDTFSKGVTLDTGQTDVVRMKVGNELYLDVDSIETMLYQGLGVIIDVDYENGIINVKSMTV